MRSAENVAELLSGANEGLDWWNVFDLIPVPIFIKDRTGLYAGCNKAYENFIGFRKAELAGKSIHDLAPKDVADLHQAKDRDLFENGQAQVYEMTVMVNGAPRRVVFHKDIYRNARGEIQGLAGAVIDITEQKEAEKALQASEEKNRDLLQAIPDSILIANSDMTIIDVKETMECAIAGNCGILGKKIHDVFPAEISKVLVERIAEVLKNGQTQVIEYQKKDLDMAEYWEARVSLISGEQALIILRNVTDRNLAETEIRKLSLIVEQSPGGIVIADADQKIIYVNSEFTRMSGYSLDDLKGQNICSFRSKAHSGKFYGSMYSDLQAGKSWQAEVCKQKKNNELYWALVSVSPIFDSKGNIMYFLGVEQDITEKKLIEETLLNQHVEIEEALKKIEMTHIQLVQQEKLAGIGQLAAGVAHEINNPVGFVASNFNTLQKYIANITEMFAKYQELKSMIMASTLSELKELAEQISAMEKKKKIEYVLSDVQDIMKESDEGLNRIKDIVKALKLFSRVDKGSEFEMYDLNNGIQNTLIIAKNEVKYIAEIVLDLKEIPLFPASAGHINQVLLNIVVNGAHAIAARKSDKLGLIKVSSYHDGQYAYCVIEDNGIGMSQETARRIFDPFFTTKPMGQGTGLGLSISHDIVVNKHKGEILVKSHEGVGTAFTVKLPCSRSTG